MTIVYLWAFIMTEGSLEMQKKREVCYVALYFGKSWETLIVDGESMKTKNAS